MNTMNENEINEKLEHAQTLIDSGQLPESLSLYEQICDAGVKNAEAWLMRGAIRGQMGSVDDAINFIKKAIDTDPEYEDAYFTLAQVYHSQGNLVEAADCCERVVALDPEYKEAWLKLSGIYGSLHRLEDAERCSRKVIELEPDNAEANVNLANALFGQRKVEEAAKAFERALQLSPNMPELHTSLGDCSLWLNRFDEALEIFKQARHLRPKTDPNGPYHVAMAYSRMGRFDDAIKCYQDALKIDPKFAPAVVAMAGVYELQGDFETAHQLIRQALDSGANYAGAAVMFARICRHFEDCEEAIALIESLLSRENIPGDVAILLGISLGQLYDRAGKYNQAFTNIKMANDKQRHLYSHEEFVKYCDDLISVFSSDKISTYPVSTNASEVPVFIVGMPRSGTSLVEQILSCHPSVHGGGELLELPGIVSVLPAETGSDEVFPACMNQLTQSVVDRMAERYLDRVKKSAPGALRITDKLPHNFQHIGLIRLLLPNARIIHCVRNPLDTCLSCYFTNFQGQHPYMYDLTSLGLHYREYQRLMQHWRDVLGIPMFEVRYEDLVANQEEISRAMIEYCGLEWDEQCLNFHKSDRHTQTASYDQVRQPMYTKSVERWKNYEQYLQPLQDALGGE